MLDIGENNMVKCGRVNYKLYTVGHQLNTLNGLTNSIMCYA